MNGCVTHVDSRVDADLAGGLENKTVDEFLVIVDRADFDVSLMASAYAALYESPVLRSFRKSKRVHAPAACATERL